MAETINTFTFFLLLTLVPALLPYAIATSMWSWRSWLVCSTVLGLPVAAVWLIEWQTSRSSEYNPGAGIIFGLTLIASVSIAIVWGAIVRAYTLANPRAGRFNFHAGGFLVLAAGTTIFFFGSMLLHH